MTQLFPPVFAEEDIVFYKTTLFGEIQDSPIGKCEGASMLRTLRKELIRSVEAIEPPAYTAAVGELLKVVTDSLVSAAHRIGPHQLIKSNTRGPYPATDEEEYEYFKQEGHFDIESEEAETSPSGEPSYSDGGLKDWESKQRRKDDAKRKRMEDEEMLINEKRVMDERGRKYRTIGPFPPPRLSIRSSQTTFSSRKNLQQRAAVETPSSTSSDHDSNEEGEDENEATLPTSSSEEPEREKEDIDAKEHLTSFLAPLSVGSLRKVGESAKAKLKPSTPHDEFVSQIVKTATKMGFEKAFHFMDKQKLPDDIVSHSPNQPFSASANKDYLAKLPESQKKALSSALGFPTNTPSTTDMWERMVAMGFLSVLTNLRLKPLKKIAQELSLTLPNTNSTVKYCEAIVFAAFPKEKARAREKFSQAKEKKVKFTALPQEMSVRGDMGYITFHISNISMLSKESERHYSPEFSFAKMKWSLLCMANKDSLALYLCQTGSVHCKFLITVINHLNSSDSICNEGTQSFSALSQENDWGFNTVIKFAELLNPQQGFLKQETDTITIEVGIVLVEPLKEVTKEKVQGKGRKPSPKNYEQSVKKLLEDEHAEILKKRIKQENAKTVKEEDRTRKDIVQKATKAFHDLNDRLKQETKRLLKEIAEREKREEQEDQKHQEKLQAAKELAHEMKLQLEDLKKTHNKATQRKKELNQEIKDVKKQTEKVNQEIKSLNEKTHSAQQKLNAIEKKVETARSQLEDLLKDEVLTTPTPPNEESDYLKNDLHQFLQEIDAESN